MQKKLIVKLNAKFYDKSVIDEALSEFSEICDGKIIDESFTIELTPKKDFDFQIESEFSNYVLGLMKNNGLN